MVTCAYTIDNEILVKMYFFDENLLKCMYLIKVIKNILFIN